MFTLLTALAFAEPPPFTGVDEAVAESELVVVGTAQRVEFQALEPGQVIEQSSLQPFWIEYRVDAVLFGDATAPGKTLRVHTGASGCEPYTIQVRRDGDRFIESALEMKTQRELDPASWLPTTPQVLILDVAADGRTSNHGFGSTPEPATEAHLAAVAKEVAKKRSN